jgi:hypothetical protein
VWRLLTPQLSPEDLHTLWCRRSPHWTEHSAQRPSGVYVDLDTSSTAVQKRTAERVSEGSADATWRRERAAREAREKADEKQRRQAQRARRAVLPALVDQPRGSTDVINELAAALIARGP